MHPAYSIIFFTTSSGLGYGLAAMLGLGLLDPLSAWVKFAHLLALALIAGGLLSSTFHLVTRSAPACAVNGAPAVCRARACWRSLLSCRSPFRRGLRCSSAHLPLIGLLGTAGAIATVCVDDLRLAALDTGVEHAADVGCCSFAGAGEAFWLPSLLRAGQTSWH